MLRSMARSAAEKPVSSGVEASSTASRSARSEPDRQPNRVRIARASQLSAAGRSTRLRARTAGRLRRVAPACRWVGSESGSQAAVRSLTRRIGIGNAEAGEDCPLQAFHFLGVRIVLVIVADQMEKSMHGQMAEMMRERLVLVSASRRVIS